MFQIDVLASLRRLFFLGVMLEDLAHLWIVVLGLCKEENWLSHKSKLGHSFSHSLSIGSYFQVPA